MNRETHDRLWKELRAARETYRQACPPQSEILVVDDRPDGAHIVATWQANINRDGSETKFTANVHHWDRFAEAQDLTPPALRRLADIIEAGQRWERNEGPWPLSKTPPPAES